MQKKYKLIELYPGSPELGYIVTPHKVGDDGSYYWSGNYFCPKNFPKFWQPLEELCVPIGTKFRHSYDDSEIYTITSIDTTLTDVIVKWETGSAVYSIEEANKYFKNKLWVKYVEKPVIFITEDGVGIKEGEPFYMVNSEFKLSFWGNYAENKKFICSGAPGSNFQEGHKAFSTEKIAEEYIQDNKPIYSRKQALAMLDVLSRDAWEGSPLDPEELAEYLI